MFRYSMEMHMVHINNRYVNVDGTLDDDYAVNADGVAVFGFLFTATWFARVHTLFTHFKRLLYKKSLFIFITICL